jgi:hypothetical protein
MHDSPAKSFWDSLLSLFLPFEIAGGLGAMVTFVLWFVFRGATLGRHSVLRSLWQRQRLQNG